VPPVRDGAPMDDYDLLFYQSLCLPRTHPDHRDICAVAIFGSPERAAVSALAGEARR